MKELNVLLEHLKKLKEECMGYIEKETENNEELRRWMVIHSNIHGDIEGLKVLLRFPMNDFAREFSTHKENPTKMYYNGIFLYDALVVFYTLVETYYENGRLITAKGLYYNKFKESE